MDDARLNRLKGRKLGEIAFYASTIALEPENRNELIELIDMINRDINDIETLLSGVECTSNDRIGSERYTGRLSASEIADEDYLNELRSGKISIPDEVEVVVVEDVPATEPIVTEEIVEEDAPFDDAEDPFMQPLFTEDDEKMLTDIRDMKNSKIDLFIERELTGNFKEEACEDVIRFTKIDIKLIDLLLKLDYSHKSRLESDLKVLVDIVNNMDAPEYGKLYVNSLNKEEAKLEVRYNEFIDRVDELVRNRFPEIVPAESE